MKKFFKKFFLLLLIGAAIYLFLLSVVLVPKTTIAIAYSKINAQLRLLKRSFNIVPFRIIPRNVNIKRFPLLQQVCSFVFQKKLSLLDKQVNLLKYRTTINYKIIDTQYEYLYNHYNSRKSIDQFLKQEISVLLHQMVNEAIENNENLNSFPEKNNALIFKQIKESMKNKGIEILSCSIINLEIIPDLNYNQIKNLLNQSLEYENTFKIEMRKIELEKLRLQQEAHNEVEYLRIIGKYIEENPLILKYIMIKKIDKNDVIFVPSSEIGFDFYNSLKKGMKKKLDNE